MMLMTVVVLIMQNQGKSTVSHYTAHHRTYIWKSVISHHPGLVVSAHSANLHTHKYNRVDHPKHYHTAQSSTTLVERERVVCLR